MRVFLTGGSGMLGQSLRALAAKDGRGIELVAPKRNELNITDKSAVGAFLSNGKFDAVIHGAARVGGIQANIKYPIEFLSENMRMNDAVIMASYENEISNLIFLGSSCMYPKDYQQPLKEEYLLAAPLEPTNEGYALAKIAGAKLCEYISRQEGFGYKTLIPSNLFGENDHFGSEASHLIAAIVSKVAAAKQAGTNEVEIWGSGNARREFLLVDDLARFILNNIADTKRLPDYLNLGYGKDHTVLEYYQMVAEVFDFKGKFTFDTSKPEGMMAKLMDSSKAVEHGWNDLTPIKDAIALLPNAYHSKV